jgi:hypothetical protein
MPKLVHLATRVDAVELLNHPDKIMQQMSIKIFQRREELICDLIKSKVLYEDEDNVIRQGHLESFSDGNAVIRDGNTRGRVSGRRIKIP